MLIHKLQPLTDVLDWLHHFWERPSTQRRIALFLLWFYLLALTGVELKRMGLYPLWLPQPPDSHFYAIHMAFTLILAMEVMSLIFVIPSSLSQSMGKQFEILTLILLRNAFKELAALPEPVHIGFDNIQAVVEIGVSGAGALCVFLCLGLYRRIARRQRFIQSPDMRMRYVMSKKLLALSLFVIFFSFGVYDLVIHLQTGKEQHFFETIYTVLIFADIAMVLIAQRYMPCYHAVFRNSGFVIGTLLMRLSLSAPPLWSPVIGLFAALFVLALTWGTNLFSPHLEPEEKGGGN
ncbi:hypothetical protein FYJ44_11155 [Desulfovibrio sp. PG-178-WT-4]|uniref:Uncharacterized protein n=1 Tax=Desulfovibrio porci TaxID=2605782 RepID=A0A6L5XN51_9BACT|nr:hypothetical protein [Desulfovibrio porci]MDY3809387.1 hypothetical protein [Desulfovibrio porci]MSS28576.1 hypothetical protein [Desulfovibrio porci]